MRQVKTILAILILASSFSAKADPILTGSWEGDWAGSGITAVFDMVIDHAADGSITGYFDWTCVSGITCFGREEFAGTFDMATLLINFATTALIDPYGNLGFASYFGSVSSDGNSMSGGDNSGGQWRASRVAVAEPGTLALLGIGFVAIGLARRRKRS